MNTVTLKMIQEAQERLKGVIRHTDLVPSHFMSIPGQREIFMKTECLQYTGSFKLRGAYNRICQLTPEEKERGVIASSAGNHAQGVALAATKSGTKSTIVMPENAPLAKIEAAYGYGADVILHGKVYDDAYFESLRIQQKTGAVFIHPFDDPDVIAGQGTIGLEILEDDPEINAVVVPIGGGGLASGIAVAIKETDPKIKVIGVETENAACMKKSFECGKISTFDGSSTMADGIAVKTPGELTFELCKKYLDEIVTVSEDEIAAGVLTLLEKRKLMSEGAGAASVAAMLYEKFKTKGKIACVVSGGNVDITALQLIIDKGMKKTGRMAIFTISLFNRPGQLSGVMDVIAAAGAHVYSISESTYNHFSDISTTQLDIIVNTFNFDHIEQIKEALIRNGIKVL